VRLGARFAPETSLSEEQIAFLLLPSILSIKDEIAHLSPMFQI
jgi:hypothetical protein